MADNNNNYIQQVQQPDAFQTIGKMMNFAGQAQQLQSARQDYQRGGIALEKERALLQPQIEQGVAQSESAKIGAEKARQSLPLEISRLQAESERARTGADEASLALKTRNENIAKNTVGALVTNPAFINGSPDARHHILNATEGFLNAQGLATKAGGAVDETRKLIDSKVSPDDMTQHMRLYIQQLSTPTEKAGALNATPGMVNNNQQVVPAVVNPYNASNPAGNKPVQLQVGPAAEQVDPNTGAKSLVGPQPANGGPWLGPEPQGAFRGDPAAVEKWLGAIVDPVERANAIRALHNQMGGVPQKPIQTGLATGQEKNVEGSVAVVNRDWEQTAKNAETAGQDVGVLQNMKKYAKGAITGVESDRRSYITGLAGLLKMDKAQLEKTNTDLLAKNSAMLALAGGDTNLAKTLAESANPNTKMTPEAIEEAANQVIGQRKLAIAKQRFLQPFKALNNENAYAAALTEFNAHADPRILQLPSMSKEEKAKLLGAMTPAEQDAFIKSTRRLHELGVSVD